MSTVGAGPFSSQKIVTGQYGIYLLAECSAYAYDEPLALERIFQGSDNSWQFKPDYFFDDPDTSTQAYIVSSASTNEIIVAFRGSQEWTDWLRDVTKTALTPYGNGAQVGVGYSQSWKSVKIGVQQAITAILGTFPPGFPDIYFTGHSLGGALATLAAFDLVANAGPRRAPPYKAHVTTFGAPDVGDAGFVQMMSQTGIVQTILLDQTDSIETWANWFLEGYRGYAPLKKTFLPAGRGHSVLNYIDLVDPYPLRLRKLDLSTPVQSLVIRTYTGQSLGGGTDDKVSLSVAVYDPTKQVDIALVGSDKPNPFESGQADTFQIYLSKYRPLTVGDFLLCQVTKSDESVFTGDWDMQGLQILVNGFELFNDTEINTTLTGPNPSYSFIGLDAMSNTFAFNPNHSAVVSGTASGEPTLTTGAVQGQILKVTMNFYANTAAGSGFYYNVTCTDPSAAKMLGGNTGACCQSAVGWKTCSLVCFFQALKTGSITFSPMFSKGDLDGAADLWQFAIVSETFVDVVSSGDALAEQVARQQALGSSVEESVSLV